MQSVQELLTHHNLATVFTREHDAILLAWPFTAGEQPAAFSPAHIERLQQAILRRFLRSAREIEPDSLTAALERSCTPAFSYRLLPDVQRCIPSSALLVTCASNAHLALTHVLERDAVFSAETIGRVIPANCRP